MLKGMFSAIGLMAVPASLLAAAGDLDTTFGTATAVSGTEITYFGIDSGQRSFAQSVIQLPDGKLVAAGYNRATSTSNYDFALVRYTASGNPDSTFDGDGRVVTAIGAGDDQGYAVIVQPDGKLVVAGTSYNGTNNDIALVRYNADGSLDATFSSDGIQTTDFSGSNDNGRALVLQADGKLVVAGTSNDGSQNRIAVVRYNSDGSLDTDFDGDGKLLASVGSTNTIGNSVIQQADGKLVVGGSIRPGTIFQFALFRFNPSGQLDTTLNSTGYVTTALGTNDYSGSVGRSVIQQADGKLILAGDAWITNQDSDFALARYNADGSLDTSFSGDGLQTTNISGVTDIACQVIQQRDGKLVVAGSGYMAPANADFIVVRYNSNGTLDTSFGGDGIVTTPISYYDDFANALVEQQDGKLVLAGQASPASARFGLARFFGEPDTDGDGAMDAGDVFPTNPAATIDADADGYPDEWASACDVACQNASGLVLDPGLDDSDNDGIKNGADTVVGDNNPPTVVAPPDIAMTATGETTAVILGSGTATDFVDGVLTAIPDTVDQAVSIYLAPGRHIITWSATDTAGNTGVAEQQVDIVPLAAFTVAGQTVGEGSLVTVTVALNGNPVEYPVKIPLQLDATSTGTNPADHDATSSTLVIAADADPANTASYQFVAGDDGLGGEPDRAVIFNLVADNGVDVLLGAAIDPDHDRHEVTITEFNVAPVVTDIVFLQNGIVVDAINTAGGPVTIRATVADANPLDSHEISWSSDGISLTAYAVGPQLVVDPMDLPAIGNTALLTAVATDNGAPLLVSAEYSEAVALATPARNKSGGGAFAPWFLLLLLFAGGKRFQRSRPT